MRSSNLCSRRLHGLQPREVPGRVYQRAQPVPVRTPDQLAEILLLHFGLELLAGTVKPIYLIFHVGVIVDGLVLGLSESKEASPTFPEIVDEACFDAHVEHAAERDWLTVCFRVMSLDKHGEVEVGFDAIPAFKWLESVEFWVVVLFWELKKDCSAQTLLVLPEFLSRAHCEGTG